MNTLKDGRSIHSLIEQLFQHLIALTRCCLPCAPTALEPSASEWNYKSKTPPGTQLQHSCHLKSCGLAQLQGEVSKGSRDARILKEPQRNHRDPRKGSSPSSPAGRSHQH